MNAGLELLINITISCVVIILISGWLKKRDNQRQQTELDNKQPMLMSKARAYTDLRNAQLLRFSKMINIYGWDELDFNNPDSWFYVVPGTVSDPKYHEFRKYVKLYEKALIANWVLVSHLHLEGQSSANLSAFRCGLSDNSRTFTSHNIEQFILYSLPEELMELEYAYMLKNKKPSEIPNLNLLKIYESMRDNTKNAYTLF